MIGDDNQLDASVILALPLPLIYACDIIKLL